MQSLEKEQYIDIRKLMIIVVSHWKYFLICIGTTLLVAVLVNRFAHRTFIASSTIIINNSDNNSRSSSQTMVLQELDMFSVEKDLQNEILILQSKPLIKEALADLDFDVSYFSVSHMISYEIYKESPFIVEFDKTHDQPVDVKLSVLFLENSQIHVEFKGKEVKIYNYESNLTKGKINKIEIDVSTTLGKSVEGDLHKFSIYIKDNVNFDELIGKKYKFQFNTNVADTYKKMLTVGQADDKSSAVKISLKDFNSKKALDFIESLTNNYLQYNLDKKNFYALNTIEYIDSQLTQIEDSLSLTENRLQSYQVANQVMDVTAKSQRLYSQIEELETRKANLALESRYYDYIQEYFQEDRKLNELIAPSSMGIEDPILTNLIEELTEVYSNIAIMERNNQQQSPYYNERVQMADNLKLTIEENINYIVGTSEKNLNEIDNKIHELERQLARLPGTQRELLGIERKFYLNDAIYTYMLETRTEAQIAKASNLPDTEMIEPPHIGGIVFPNKVLNFAMAIILGLLIPICIIILKLLLRNKIITPGDIENFSNLPFLGTIPRHSGNFKLAVLKEPDSHVAECYRLVRSNLDFFENETPNQVILVSSFFPGEGKSFTATNIASTLSLTGKKTVLLGFDLRNPTLHNYFSLNNLNGITSYLINKSRFDDIIINTGFENLDIILSGDIPPNPAELIASDKTKELIGFLKENYEYVVVDSPPVDVVVDTYTLMKYSDVNILVTRQNYTNKFAFKDILSKISLKKFQNLSLILNYYRAENTEYSYKAKYGKYYHKKKKRKFFFQK